MKVERVTLRNFRNVQDCSLSPQARLNFLVGANAQGKTSFIEAIGFFSSLRSFRSTKPHEVIRWGEREAEITCQIHYQDPSGSDWRTDLSVRLTVEDPEGLKVQKLATINGKPYRSAMHYMAQRFASPGLGFHTILFNPSDHELIRGEPKIRRDYLDRVISAEDLDYLESFKRYQKILQHRNSLLRDPDSQALRMLPEFTQQLAGEAAQLTAKRLRWIGRLHRKIDGILRNIAPKQRTLRVGYKVDWLEKNDLLSNDNNKLESSDFSGHAHGPSLQDLESNFLRKAGQLRNDEIRSGTTLIGPHRDDWFLFLDDRTLKGHGSQGEIRSALLALKITEIELFKESTGVRPLFLLDDFSSELDEERRNFLLRFLEETDLQVFVTTTEMSASAGKRFRVSDGFLEEEGLG